MKEHDATEIMKPEKRKLDALYILRTGLIVLIPVVFAVLIYFFAVSL